MIEIDATQGDEVDGRAKATKKRRLSRGGEPDNGRSGPPTSGKIRLKSDNWEWHCRVKTLAAAFIQENYNAIGICETIWRSECLILLTLSPKQPAFSTARHEACASGLFLVRILWYAVTSDGNVLLPSVALCRRSSIVSFFRAFDGQHSNESVSHGQCLFFFLRNCLRLQQEPVRRRVHCI